MIDPYRVLGVSPSADDETIRRAYLDAVRRHPPERDAARFERIRVAYDAIKDSQARVRHEWFEKSPATIEDLLDLIRAESKPGTARVPAETLLAVLRRA